MPHCGVLASEPMSEHDVLVDCEAGRRLGCDNLCCRLMVGLTPADLEAGLEPQSPLSGLLKQDIDGRCHYLDRENWRCTIWDKRPLPCRLYDCNQDPKLQVVLKEGFTSFTRAIALAKEIPEDEWTAVPLLPPDATTD